MIRLKHFTKYKLPILNNVKGGVSDTSYCGKNGVCYKDYSYRDNEINETNSAPNCIIYGGQMQHWSRFKYLFLSLAITISCNLFSQDCDCFLNYYKAESLYFNKTDKDKSVQYYRNAFKDPKFGSLVNVYNAMDIVYRLDSFEYAKTLLEKSFIKGGRMDFLDRIDKYYPNLKYDKERLQKITDSVRITRNPYDSLLIKDLEYMDNRDQLIRKNEELENHSILEVKIIDRMNYLWLKEIIVKNGGKLPNFDQIGTDGFENIETILLHLDLDYIIDLWPYFIRSIKEDRAPINEILLYQLDRTMVAGQDIVYLEDGKLVKKKKNSKIPNSEVYYQNLGGMDVFLMEEKQSYWWPFNPELDTENTSNIRKELCLDSLEDQIKREPYRKLITIDEFVKKVK